MADEKRKNTSKDGNPGDSVSWQAQKSAMTRDKILDAAIDCFIKMGFTNVTTAKVSDSAGVSRGAMLHHFPSKLELIRAAIEYLHDKLVEDFTKRMTAIPSSLEDKEKRRAGLDAYYDHLHCDLFAAYHELCVAGRTDPELAAYSKYLSSSSKTTSLKVTKPCGKNGLNVETSTCSPWI